jgi:acetone carboxylase gamma subunit
VEDVISGVKQIMTHTLGKCDKFLKVSTNDTINEVFDKVNTIEDLKYYVFEDNVISACMSVKDVRNITTMLNLILDDYRNEINAVYVAIVEAL